MSEYLTNVGRRAEFRQNLLAKRIVAEGLRDSLRLALDPIPPVESLDAERIMNLAAAFVGEVSEIEGIEAQLSAIEKVIGK